MRWTHFSFLRPGNPASLPFCLPPSLPLSFLPSFLPSLPLRLHTPPLLARVNPAPGRHRPPVSHPPARLCRPAASRLKPASGPPRSARPRAQPAALPDRPEPPRVNPSSRPFPSFSSLLSPPPPPPPPSTPPNFAAAAPSKQPLCCQVGRRDRVRDTSEVKKLSRHGSGEES